jgi:hypothetical protein
MTGLWSLSKKRIVEGSVPLRSAIDGQVGRERGGGSTADGKGTDFAIKRRFIFADSSCS